MKQQQAILDSLPAHIAVLDPNGVIVLINRSWKSLSQHRGCFWVSKTEPGINYVENCRKAGAIGAETATGIQSVLNGVTSTYSRTLICDSKVESHWFHFSATRLAGGEPGAVVACTDITEQKKGDDARAHLAAIVESSTDSVSASDLNGIIVSWNKGAERMYGYTAAQMVGQSIQKIIPRDRRRELERAFGTVVKGERLAPFETLRRCKDGRLLPVTINLSAIKDLDGKVTGLSAIARDVTERRLLEAEVLRVAEREQRHIAQDLHDGLGQQLAGVACMANVLQQQLAMERSHHGAMAGKIARLLNDASSQTRDLSRGLYPVPQEPRGLMAALQALAERTTDLYQVNCCFFCPRLVPVRGTTVANHLYRIAQEAVSNAVRHGHPSRIDIRLTRTRYRLVLGVADNGIGLSKSKQRRGGIGLRIMNYRADLISGTLVVQRSASGGTEVVCTVDEQSYEKAVASQPV